MILFTDFVNFRVEHNHKLLLIIDSIINLILGIILLLFPLGIASYLGIPESELAFYPTILGAVLLGIGIALLIELNNASSKFSGLGLGGAIVINLLGSIVLLIWLIFTDLHIPTHGKFLLWIIGLSVFSIAVFELIVINK
jgi:hypothetical protein